MTEKSKMLCQPFKKGYSEHTEKFLATSEVGAVGQELSDVTGHPAVPSPV